MLASNLFTSIRGTLKLRTLAVRELHVTRRGWSHDLSSSLTETPLPTETKELQKGNVLRPGPDWGQLLVIMSKEGQILSMTVASDIMHGYITTKPDNWKNDTRYRAVYQQLPQGE